jgi:hypothetical protein
MTINFIPDNKNQFGFVPDKPSLNSAAGGLTKTQTYLDNLRSSAAQAQQQAQQAASPLGIATETAKGTLGTIANTGLKFLGSAVKAPADIVMGGLFGKTADTKANIPGIGGPQKSFQGTFQSETIPNVEAGVETPLGATARTVGGVVSGAADVLGAAGLAKGAFGAAKTAVNPIKSLLAQRAEKKATQTAIKAITPKMTAGQIVTAAKGGKTTKPFMGSPKVDLTKDTKFMKTVDAVKGIVKGKSPIQDLNNVKNALSSEADTLKVAIQQNDHPYLFRELQSRLNKVEEPISLRGTPFERQIKPIKEAAISMARKNGGTISSLLDARKEFDNLVERTYPNLYESDNAPMRNAITAIRNEMNNFIEENLPDVVGFRDSLGKQKSFYDAIDNLASKVPEEIKKGGFIKKALKNPFITTAIGGGIGGAVVNKVTGD